MSGHRTTEMGRAAVARLLALAAAALVACGAPSADAPPRRAPAPAAGPFGGDTAGLLVRFLDRPVVVAVREQQDIPLSRLAVMADGRADTLPGILVRHLPALLGDSAVTGLDWSGQRLARGFLWRRRDRALVSVSLPPDLPRGLPVVRLAPDGRHVVYVAERRCGARHCATIVLVRWPDGTPVARHALDVAYGDHLDPRDRAMWLDPRRVAVELYDGRRGTRLVALVDVADRGLRAETQPIPSGDAPD